MFMFQTPFNLCHPNDGIDSKHKYQEIIKNYNSRSSFTELVRFSHLVM